MDNVRRLEGNDLIGFVELEIGVIRLMITVIILASFRTLAAFVLSARVMLKYNLPVRHEAILRMSHVDIPHG